MTQTIHSRINLTAIALASWTACATDFTFPSTVHTQQGFLLTAATTNGTTGVLGVEANALHTVHISAVGTATNCASVVLSRSLDAATWIPFSTNALPGGTAAEVTATGKWSYFQATLTTTNAFLTVTATYLGGR